MNSHQVVRCPSCEEIWLQCRCFGPREEKLELCPDCKGAQERGSK